MSTIINLFGTGIRCWICEIPMHRYNQLKEVAEFHETTLDNILFDLEILQRLGYKHWKKIYAIEEINGFLIEPKNKVEIKNGNRIITKFTANEILGNEAFFKLYATKEVDFKITNRPEHKYLLIGQKEIGSFKYRVNLDNFEIEKLCFSFCKGINNENSVVTISYNGVGLKPIKTDTMIRSFFVNYISFR
jgi:hypothetical protein